MSITELEYDEQSETLQVSIKFFIDDLNFVLEKEGNEKLFLGTEKETMNTTIILKKYLSEHFILEQSNKNLKFEFIGKEAEVDYIWVYLEYANYNVEEKALLTHTALTEYFSDQNNKVNFYNGNITKSFTLNKDKISEEF